jgi:hypothetical protein
VHVAVADAGDGTELVRELSGDRGEQVRHPQGDPEDDQVLAH